MSVRIIRAPPIGCPDHLGDSRGCEGRWRYWDARGQASFPRFGARVPGIAISLHNLASLRSVTGDLVGARLLYERVLGIQQKELGSNHPYVAGVLNNLASLTEREGNLIDAKALHERALAIREAALGPEHPDTGLSAQNLARVLHLVGDFAGAQEGFDDPGE
jgi:tetratricopeptide (TPR) repeat protein